MWLCPDRNTRIFSECNLFRVKNFDQISKPVHHCAWILQDSTCITVAISKTQTVHTRCGLYNVIRYTQCAVMERERQKRTAVAI